MNHNKTRYQRKRDRLAAVVRAVAGAIIVAIVALLLLGMSVREDSPVDAAQDERRARFAAQARYYEILDLYGDAEGAEDAAQLSLFGGDTY